MLTALRDLVLRYLGTPAGGPRQIAAFGWGLVSPEYPSRLAMSQLVRHPYVYACVNKIATDLGNLPLIAVEIGDDGRSERARQLPPELVRRPNASQSWPELRAQWVADEALSGNGFLYRPPEGGSTYRLHPALVQVESDGLGLPRAYKFNGTMTLAPPTVAHVMGLSWRDGVQELVGESPMRALHDELSAAASAKELAAVAAKRGRPEWLLSPADSESEFNDANGEVIKKFEQQLQKGQGSIFIGAALQATPLSTSLRDLEYQVLQERADHAILAVFGVPPSLIGIPAANYGTSKQDARTYWQALQQRAVRFDAALTELFGVPGRLEIRHDFSRVEAIQVARTERIEQAARLVEMGASPLDAAQYCGLDDPPLGPDTQPRASAMTPASAAEPEEPQGTRRSVRAVLAESCERYSRAVRRGSYDLRAVDLEALEPLLGVERAAEVAELIHAGVRRHVVACAEQGTEPLVAGLAVFGPSWAASLEAA